MKCQLQHQDSRRSPPRKPGRRSSWQTRSRSRSHSRSRQRHQVRGRNKSINKKRNRFASKPPAGSGGSGGAGKDQKSGECSSPSSFEEAWSSGFFDPVSKQLVSDCGFDLDSIPDLLSLPLGGRLRHCISSWHTNWRLDQRCFVLCQHRPKRCFSPRSYVKEVS